MPAWDTAGMNAVHIGLAFVLRGVLAPVNLKNVDAVPLVPVQAVVVMISPVAAVAGGTILAGLSPAVECPYFGYRNFGGIAVLIAGGKGWQNKGTEQCKRENT